MKQRVLVLLSTYNGEKYLREQIDSILAQEKVAVSILVRDDGSTDNTRAILAEYCENHNNVFYIKSNENMGPGNSFMELVYYAGRNKLEQYDYYALSDQDDVWLKMKLLRAINAIEKCADIDKPILYCSNQIIYKNGKECGLRYNSQPRIDLPSVINSNKVSGCTFVMNKALLEQICFAPHPSRELMARRMHDVWIVLAALCLGEIIYDSKSFILYRIHDNNVVGIKRGKMSKKIQIYWKNLTDKKYGKYRSWTAYETKSAFSEIQGLNREVLEELSEYWRDKELKKRLLADHDTLSKIDNNILFARLKIIFNIL